MATPPIRIGAVKVHDRHLPGRPAKTDETQREPEAQRFAKTHCRWFLHMETLVGRSTGKR